MFHVSGINWITLQTLAVGGKMTILPGFDPQTFLTALLTTKVHCIVPNLQYFEYNLVHPLIDIIKMDQQAYGFFENRQHC